MMGKSDYNKTCKDCEHYAVSKDKYCVGYCYLRGRGIFMIYHCFECSEFKERDKD